jgi:hypothetical protein
MSPGDEDAEAQTAPLLSRAQIRAHDPPPPAVFRARGGRTLSLDSTDNSTVSVWRRHMEVR